VVTHDLNLGFAVADRLGMMHGGQLIETGSADAIRTTANPIVRAFIHTQMKIVAR